MWGIIPAAGRGSRIQPLAFSKELLPVGSRIGDDGIERPCAVSEFILERMILGGADKICFVISPGKSDIMEYFGARYGPARICRRHRQYSISLPTPFACLMRRRGYSNRQPAGSEPSSKSAKAASTTSLNSILRSAQ